MSTTTFDAPVSHSQERLWFLDRFDPGTPAYNVPAALPLGGHLDTHRIEDTLNRIVARHESLRTSFGIVDGLPVQTVHGSVQIRLQVHDLRDMSDDDRMRAQRELSAAEAATPFDLASAPLLRARLLCLTENAHLLLLTLHHIVADGWSLGILFREFHALYVSSAPLPELPIQYADFASWQRGRLQGEYLDRLLSYWREALDGAPDVLELPSDKPRPRIQSHRGALRSFSLDSALSARIGEFAVARGATPFMVLLAAFQVLLSRFSCAKDIVVGTPVANRNRTELEGVIGLFSNTLVCRGRLEDDPSFVDHLQQVSSNTLGAYEHHELPFEHLVSALQPRRAPDHSPIFQVFFSLQNTPTLQSRASDVEAFDAIYQAAKFDLSLLMGETADGLVGSFEYCTDLFEEATVLSLRASFVALLESAVAVPQRPVSKLGMLGPTARHDIIAAATRGPLAAQRELIGEVVWEQAASSGERVAVTLGKERLTYAELAAESDRIASHLVELGVGAGDRVGLCGQRTPTGLSVLLGIFRSGAVYVPLDPSLPPARLQQMADDAQLRALFVGRETLGRAPQISGATLAMHKRPWQGCSLQQNDPQVGGGDLAYVVYTSGSTGTPKGVAVPHHVLGNLIPSSLTDSSLVAPRTLQFASWGFDVSMQEMFSAWVAGSELVIARELDRRDPYALLDTIREHGIERLYMPPVALYQLAAAALAEGAPELALREVIAAGEQLRVTPALRDWFLSMPGCRLINQYGPSESHIVTEFWLDEDPKTWAALPPIGIGLPGTSVHVLDMHLEPVPDGAMGEIYVGGQLARGYLGRPDLDAERFIGDPFQPGALLYTTGDRGRRRPDGNVEFLGRADRQVKVRGYRVELGEVDHVLSQHAHISEVATIARRRDDQTQLISYLVPRGEAPSAPDLRAFLGHSLADYMIPIAFVVVDGLPRNTNGKLDHRRLPDPDRASAASQTGSHTEPRNDLERRVCELWKKLLDLEEVGVDDDFFVLGGHSLLVVQLAARLREAFGVEISISSIFESRTVTLQACRVAESQKSSEEEAMAELLDELEGLSEEEAERLLDHESLPGGA